MSSPLAKVALLSRENLGSSLNDFNGDLVCFSSGVVTISGAGDGFELFGMGDSGSGVESIT